MYKSKLQELCQKNHWTLPTYTSTKQGLDHNPSFSATVVVNGQSFHTSGSSKSSKEAQNDAARVAFNHFSPTDDPLLPPIPNASSFPQPYFLSSSTGAITDVETIHGVGLGQTFQQTPQEDDKTSSSVNPQTIGSTTFLVSQNKFRDVQHVYKSHLQMYTQKNKLIAPSYTSEREGPPHASRFKCRVTVDGKIFESPEFHSTLKEAEHAAAKVALMSLSPDVVQKDDATFHKNLLQELVQRKGLHLPTYSTERFGEPHCPVFVSTVEIEGKRFSGEKEKTKKLAETSAAKAAYIALKEGKSSVGLPILSSSQQVHEAQNLLSPCSKSNVSVNVTTDMRTNLSSTTIPVQAEDQIGREGGLSLSDINGGTQDTISSDSSESKTKTESSSSSSSSSPSVSNNHTKFVVDLSVEPNDTCIKPSPDRIILSCKKVTIYPATKPIPAGSTLFNLSDENWDNTTKLKSFMYTFQYVYHWKQGMK
ncbi:hypothetical protein F8388_025886 [Cannabis sativa]|uniref:DRBM domain-containing protein n=1 Tax=Cannabis sativa TaxID=3483 RepID=A0A7J6FA48_CANSA|nr:hypothetical protein F8388_025886 [Cannabis sativa]